LSKYVKVKERYKIRYPVMCIDPGLTNTGYLTADEIGGKVVISETNVKHVSSKIGETGLIKANRIIDTLRDTMQAHSVRTVIVEGQFVGKHPQSVIKLVKFSGRIEQITVDQGANLIRIQPGAWQGALGVRKVIVPTKPIITLKKRQHQWYAKNVAWKELGSGVLARKNLTQDEADAMCIFYYVWREIKNETLGI